MKDLKADLQAKKMVYNNNPIDKWCFFNSVVKTDINGNIQLVKMSDSRNRVDGTAALIDGYKILQDKMLEYQSLI